MKLFIFALIFLGCARSNNNAAETVITVPEESLISGPRFVLIPDSVEPGNPITIGYADNFEAKGISQRPFHAVLINSVGKRITKSAFFNLDQEEGEPELKAAILVIPSTAAAGDATISIESSNGIVHMLPFTIEPREFPAEIIHLNQANTDLRTKPDPKKTAESELLWKILSHTGTEIYSGERGERFVFPVDSSRRTSVYGGRRVYQYSTGSTDTTIHAGIDIGVPTGTEVRACAAGKVVLARPRIVTGNTVIVEHLPGFYSLYYHMDKISVQENAMVEAGFPLGTSGSTGLATGPHLHWEIRVSTENADPDAFLSRPILDKNDIINRIKEEK